MTIREIKCTWVKLANAYFQKTAATINKKFIQIVNHEDFDDVKKNLLEKGGEGKSCKL